MEENTHSASVMSSSEIAVVVENDSPVHSVLSEYEGIQTSPMRFVNRELAWLNFNQRVIEEAESLLNPLLERVRFLSISARNLDEFYSVRVAGLMGQVREGTAVLSPDGATPVQQLEAVRLKARYLKQEQQRIWRQLRIELATEDINLLSAESLTDEDHAWLSAFFDKQIFPVLTPLAVDPSHPLPFIPNKGLALVLCLKAPDTGRHMMDGIVVLPAQLPRFLPLPTKGKERRFMLLEDIIPLFAASLFPGLAITSAGLLRIIRDTDVEFEDEAEDLVSSYETALKRRRRGVGIHLELESSVPETLGREIGEEMGVSAGDVMTLPEMVGVVDLVQLVSSGRADLVFPAYTPRFPQRVLEYEGDCFAAIRAEDLVVHHPFESFDVVVQFLQQAALDPNVLAIKQTLYRTSRDSPIVQALIQAAEAGKSVTAVVELRARFDEEANIRLSRALEAAGVQLVFGLAHYKTHAKLSLVVRREAGMLRTYAHFGTGNYHPVTARVYTDLSFFTCEPALVEDSARLFNYVTGCAVPEIMREIAFSPVTIRTRLEALVHEEMAHAQAGRPASIWLKMNSLVDPGLIDLLYEASQAGVKIVAVVRGMCCLRPGVRGLSETIQVRSIVGRFLEHSRIFAFGNGRHLPSRQAKVFISSADWMQRNMDRRVEVMVPMTNPTVHAQILGQIMSVNLRDTLQSWRMMPDATWQRVSSEKRQFSAHDYFMNNPSLSGRGSASPADAIPELYMGFETGRENQTIISSASISLQQRAAIVDLGSNSVRMVVFEGIVRNPLPIFNDKTTIRLGEGLEATGRLSDEGGQKALAVLERYGTIAKAMGADPFEILATAAVRDAVNGPEFVKAAQERLPHARFRVLNGEEEADYSATGVLCAVPQADGLVADIGGGSLELIRVAQGRYFEADTTPLGVIRLRERSRGNMQNAAHLAGWELDRITWLSAMQERPLYLVGGAFRALARLHIERTAYPLNMVHLFRLSQEEAREMAVWCVEASRKTLEKFQNVPRKRLLDVPFAATALLGLLERRRPSEVIFSAEGLREGWYMRHVAASVAQQDPMQALAGEMAERLGRNASLSSTLVEWTAPLFAVREVREEETRLRKLACMVSDIGSYDHPQYRAEQTYRRLLYGYGVGFDHVARSFLALVLAVRYKIDINDPLLEPSKLLLSKSMVARAIQIGLALRLAYTLCAGAEILLDACHLVVEDSVLVLSLGAGGVRVAGSSIKRCLERLADALELPAVLREV